MKKVKKMLNCLEILIKKFFFNYVKNDKNQECKNEFKLNFSSPKDSKENEVEEYLNNYKSTTRWQTI
jgi:hypothetical protein